MPDHLLRLRRTALATLVLALALAAPAMANARTLSARRGNLNATVSYRTVRSGLHAQLTIARAGRVVYRAPVSAPGCGAGCRLASGSALSIPMLAAVDGTAHPAVVLQLVSGENGCCAIAEVFTENARRHTVAVAVHDFGVPNLALRDLGRNGGSEFVSADGNFIARFTDAAMSGLPVQVWVFAGGSFELDTLAYPHLIAADARHWLTAYRAAGVPGHDSVGFFAAWAADEDELGAMDTAVSPFLSREVANGDLAAPFMSGRRFAALLPPFLSARGYVPMCGGG